MIAWAGESKQREAGVREAGRAEAVRHAGSGRPPRHTRGRQASTARGVHHTDQVRLIGQVSR